MFVQPSLKDQLIGVLQEVVEAKLELFPHNAITFISMDLPLGIVEAGVVLQDVEETEKGFPLLKWTSLVPIPVV